MGGQGRDGTWTQNPARGTFFSFGYVLKKKAHSSSLGKMSFRPSEDRLRYTGRRQVEEDMLARTEGSFPGESTQFPKGGWTGGKQTHQIPPNSLQCSMTSAAQQTPGQERIRSWRKVLSVETRTKTENRTNWAYHCFEVFPFEGRPDHLA